MVQSYLEGHCNPLNFGYFFLSDEMEVEVVL